MKNLILLMSITSLMFLNVSAQTVEEKNDNKETFTVVEVMPEYPGGEEALIKFLDKNLQYPKEARNKGIQGKVWAGFIVDKDGTLINIEILRGIGGGCDEEVLRVLKLMPKWKPGTQSGVAVAVKYRYPINFTLR